VARKLELVLVVMMGLPGAGKSTLARALCRTRGYARVDRDAIRAAMFPPEKKGSDPISTKNGSDPFFAAQKAAANEAVWRAAAALLQQRRGVVIDGMTFASQAGRGRARALARRLRARCVEVLVECPVDLARRRVRRSRAHPARDRSASLVSEVAARFAPVSRGTIRVDAREPTRAQLRVLLASLVSSRAQRGISDSSRRSE
jgi:hypothetical protein